MGQNTPDWWGHQYLQAINQIAAKDLGGTVPWPGPDNGYSQVYGLEPNYPCCTTNHQQGSDSWLFLCMHVLIGS
jgi:hypothetical protein